MYRSRWVDDPLEGNRRYSLYPLSLKTSFIDDQQSRVRVLPLVFKPSLA